MQAYCVKCHAGGNGLKVSQTNVRFLSHPGL
jgi:hypothetical protein